MEGAIPILFMCNDWSKEGGSFSCGYCSVFQSVFGEIQISLREGYQVSLFALSLL